MRQKDSNPASIADWQNANLPTTSEAWTELTDTEVVSLYRMENQLKLAVTVAQNTETAFYEARSAAFATFENQKQTEFASLQTEWQTKEDAGFII